MRRIIIRSSAVSALLAMLLVAPAASPPAPTSAGTLPDMYTITADACLAVTGSSNCLSIKKSEGIFSQSARLNLKGTIDTNFNGIVTREEVSALDLDANHLHQVDGGAAVVLFVADDGPVRFATTKGLFKTDPFTLTSQFVCNVSPADAIFGNTLYADEDCDNDGQVGDGLIFAHLVADGGTLGAGTITATDEGTTQLLASLPVEAVGEAASIVANSADASVEDGLIAAQDCALPRDLTALQALGAEPGFAVLGVRAKSAQNVDVANVWVKWSVSNLALAKVATPSGVTLDLGDGEIVAYNLLCGVFAPGILTVTAELWLGPILGASTLIMDPNVGTGSTQFTIDVTECDGEPDGMCDSFEANHPCLDPQIDDSALDADGDGIANISEYTQHLDPCDVDTDGDTCSDPEELGGNELFGGDRDPRDFWDFYNVTPDPAIDLNDVIAILQRFGFGPGHPSYDPIYDRMDGAGRPDYRPIAASGTSVGIDIEDAILNLQSLGHQCAAPP